MGGSAVTVPSSSPAGGTSTTGRPSRLRTNQMAFAISRIAYVVVYTLGIPLLRTLAFLVGWLATLYLALVLMGLV